MGEAGYLSSATGGTGSNSIGSGGGGGSDSRPRSFSGDSNRAGGGSGSGGTYQLTQSNVSEMYENILPQYVISTIDEEEDEAARSDGEDEDEVSHSSL